MAESQNLQLPDYKSLAQMLVNLNFVVGLMRRRSIRNEAAVFGEGASAAAMNPIHLFQH
jgi:hypothetical protein